MGGTGGAEYPPFPGAKKKSLAGKTLLATGAMVKLRLVSQEREEAYFEDPLNFLLEIAPVDEV